jgi:nucleotide-binding universal stress UspA family protein
LGFAIEPEAAAAEARRRLDELVAEGKRHGVDVQPLVLEGPAATGILNAAAENLVDLILLRIGKKGILERLLWGTTAEQVARHATVPVLFIPVDVETEEKKVTDTHQHVW